MNELGDLQHQAEVLNNAFSVHFMCKSDAENLVKHGLNATKVRIVYGAIDSECFRDLDIKRSPKTILLASVYSQRKGVEFLPQIIARLPEWKFIILGRGWSDFLKESKIDDCPNVDYRYFSKETRNIAMSEASVFLSLSKLEGGPIPLIESMSMDIYPVATDTGFASDLITQGVDGFVLENPPAIEEVCKAIVATEGLVSKPSAAVSHLNWDRIAEIVVTDFRCISTS
jgi:glycosyltransferase involved in cell wall biosynthesis